MAEALFEGITQSWHSLRWKKPRGMLKSVAMLLLS